MDLHPPAKEESPIPSLSTYYSTSTPASSSSTFKSRVPPTATKQAIEDCISSLSDDSYGKTLREIIAQISQLVRSQSLQYLNDAERKKALVETFHGFMVKDITKCSKSVTGAKSFRDNVINFKTREYFDSSQKKTAKDDKKLLQMFKKLEGGILDANSWAVNSDAQIELFGYGNSEKSDVPDQPAEEKDEEGVKAEAKEQKIAENDNDKQEVKEEPAEE
ncbi:uncharacterized protein RSE6_07238 [Rhynchosporium secalis]|uniref:Uncharacterized protein n=1 Tax=Rhynchosporium secalis TaxID=38038 RepID=A0A1E1MCJ1_RHYSE|nr:uncharacterized protein RSE6_07238 [Rhynchosporium secalis]